MRPGVLFGALFMLLAAGATPEPARFPPSSLAFPPASAAPPPRPRRGRRPRPRSPTSPSLLAAALPPDGTSDIVLVDWPATPGTPHVRAATVVGVAPAAIKSVLLDASHYRKIVPALIRADASRSPAGLPTVEWEVEVPLFNLSGTLVIHERPDGAEIQLVDGDFSPGRLTSRRRRARPAAARWWSTRRWASRTRAG